MFFFSFSNGERAAPQLEDPGELSGADEHPCSMRPMCHKGKREQGVYWNTVSVLTSTTKGKDKLRKFEKLFVHGTVSLWIGLVFASRT